MSPWCMSSESTRILDQLLCFANTKQLVSECDRTPLEAISALARAAFFEHDAAAAARVHQFLYRVNAATVSAPWDLAEVHPDHPLIQAARSIIELVWEQCDRINHTQALTSLPSVEEFPGWVRSMVCTHMSNVDHPLFQFLRDEATYNDLRHFFWQETPFDIFFGDLLTLMMPGIYGPMKVELCKNFLDEMGFAVETRMHRTLRLDMMKELKIPLNHHVEHVEDYCLEELRLANMYFDAVRNRSKLPQAFGMMLATELMVPGRLEYQIEGWRRVGMPEASLTYLIEHTTVDVEHANGWMENVVVPLLVRRGELMADIVLGVQRRLANAGAVCDRMLADLAGLQRAQNVRPGR